MSPKGLSPKTLLPTLLVSAHPIHHSDPGGLARLGNLLGEQLGGGSCGAGPLPGTLTRRPAGTARVQGRRLSAPTPCTCPLWASRLLSQARLLSCCRHCPQELDAAGGQEAGVAGALCPLLSEPLTCSAGP